LMGYTRDNMGNSEKTVISQAGNLEHGDLTSKN
jgi:hypothetical protein